MIPGLFERRQSVGVADELYVRAVFIDNGSAAIAIVQVDAIAVTRAVVDAVRRRISRRPNLRGTACTIAATHTHSGGPVCDLFSTSSDPEYCDRLVDAIVDAITCARERQCPCRVGTSVSHVPGVAFNRRFVMMDGSQMTHPGKGNPDIVRAAGPADDTVTTIGFVDAESMRPLGCLVNFGCHATHMNGVRYSADYPRWIVDTLQGVYGSEYGVVFTNAPCADVTQIDNLDPRPLEFGTYWCERTGRATGAAALQGLATMDVFTSCGVSVANARIYANVRRSSPEDVKRARALVKKHGPASGDVEACFARELLALHENRAPERVSLEIQALRIADTFLWSVPGELFQQVALEVRAQSPFPKTAGISLANGYFGYMGTPEAYTAGGYEVRLARSSMLESTAGTRVGETAAGLAKKLYDNARDELRQLPQTYIWPTESDTALDGIRALESNRR
jgi:hypothetical protein